MEIIKNINSKEAREKVVAVLNAGGLIIYPTETCYGVGVDGTNPEAVTKLLKYKNRPAGKPISVAVGDKQSLFQLIENNNQVENIANKFLPGPITVVGKSLGKVDKRLESEIGTLGVRLPAYPSLLELLQEFGKPLTSTSANLSGERRPYDVQKDLLDLLPESKKQMIDLVIDAGELEHNPPSLVIDTTQTNKVFREGLITPDDIQNGEVFTSESVEDTQKLGRNIANDILRIGLNNTIIFLLEGELGAGKTQFSIGVGRGLGVAQTINSPSYNIIKEYDFEIDGKREQKNEDEGVGEGRFYHIDLWRQEGKISLQDLGIDLQELITDKNRLNVICIEWPETLSDDLTSVKSIGLNSVKILKLSETQRRIVVTKII